MESEKKLKTSYELILPFMEANGINKSRLADIAGVETSAVTKWVQGGSIRIEKLKRIADFFKVDVRELLPSSISIPVSKSESTPELDAWKKRALDAESELRRYKAAFSKIVKSLH